MADHSTNPSLAERLRTVQAGLRPDLEVSRHTFRNQPSYVVRNPITFQSHSLSPSDYHVLISLDADKPLSRVFDELVAARRLEQEQEELFYAFVVKLHQLGFLNLPITDGKSLYSRFRRRQASQRRATITGFLFWRVPLFNPDSMLDRTLRYVRPLFSPVAVALWTVLMLCSAGIIWHRWDDFKEPLQTILVAENLAGLWVLLVVLKLIHEFGHAYICKLFGGKVPEMGAYFICFTPCAYVDASASWGFASKRQRIAVSLGGMYVESVVAALALLVWNATGPSLLNSFAHQTVTLASIVTIAFNINPLMRYDGYYILSDLIEIPNLRERSNAQLQAVCKRWLLGIRSDVLPFSPGGRVLLFLYGACSSAWKAVLVVAICAGVALKIYILGAVMAAIYGFTVLWGTVVKFVAYLWKSPETAPVRGRAIALGAVVLAGVPLMVAAIPLCKPVKVRGVVTTIGERPARAQTSGFLRQYEVVPGQSVETGSVLCVLENAHVRATADVARAQYALLNLEADCELAQHPTTAAIVQRRAEHVRNIMRETQRDADNLSVRAPLAGEVIDCDANPRSGRFIQEGDAIATIASGDWIVRAPVTAEQIADARPFVGQKVRVRLLGQTSRELAGTVTDVAEIGSAKIVPRSLTQLGGGTVAVAPDTLTAAEPYFEIIVRLDDAAARLPHGATALVNLHARPQTIGSQLHRSALRFLNKLRS